MTADIVPFRPRREDVDVQEITRAVFFALAFSGDKDCKTTFQEWRKAHPAFRDVDVRLAFSLGYRAMAGFERILLDRADDHDDGGAA